MCSQEGDGGGNAHNPAGVGQGTIKGGGSLLAPFARFSLFSLFAERVASCEEPASGFQFAFDYGEPTVAFFPGPFSDRRC